MRDSDASKSILAVLLGAFMLLAFAYSAHALVTSDTGVGCEAIGTWDAAKKTCTLNTDVAEGIIFGDNDDGITLDCNHHSITGGGADALGIGITLSGRTGVTITRCIVEDFYLGIYLFISASNIVEGNTVKDNSCGIEIESGGSNVIEKNIVINNATCGIVTSEGFDFIIGNAVNNNGFLGISILQGGATVVGNTVSGHTSVGVSAIEGSVLTLTKNTIVDNDVGVVARQTCVLLERNSINRNHSDGAILLSINGYSCQSTVMGNIANNNGGYGYVFCTYGEFPYPLCMIGPDAVTNVTLVGNKCMRNGSGGSDPSGMCFPQP